MRWRSRRPALLAASACLLILYIFSPSTPNPEQELLARRRQDISAAFDHAWAGYSTHCMGHDSLHPVTNTCDDDFGGWGATAIDTITTAILMRKEDVVVEILEFISKLDFTVVQGGTSIQVFEVVIRHFGGMISAYDLLDGPLSHLAKDKRLRRRLYDQMVRLGDILSCAFNTPSGVPRNWLDPATCKTDDGKSNTIAGAGSLILEFARLSDITGNPTYVQLAQRAENYLLAPLQGEPFPGLLGSFISVKDGLIISAKGSWGALADSFYEYLLKAYMYDSRKYALYLERWKLAAESTIQSIASHPYGRPNEVYLPFWEGEHLFNAMDSLSWFAGGSFIMGGVITANQTLLDFGLQIADTAGALYNSTTTGLGPEYVHWTPDCNAGWVGEEGIPCNATNSVRPADASFQLRPEALESWYYAYRATRDVKYRGWAWDMFVAITRVCKTESGFSAISDVTAADGGRKLDKQESFVFAEVFKYLYLIHLDDDPAASWQVQDSRSGVKNAWVLNTEAHPLKVVGQHV